MKKIFILFFVSGVLFSCGQSPNNEDDGYLEEEEHLDQKDHVELSDNDSVPDVD